MAVLQSYATYGALFGGTNTYTRTTAQTGLSSPSAGQGVVVFAGSNLVRSISSVVLGSTGTTTALSLVGSIANDVYVFAGTASGSETNADVVVTASGSVSDDTTFGVLVSDGWDSDQSGADVQTLSASGSGAGPWTWTIPAVTPPTATNLIVASIGRGNRSFTDDADFTSVSVGDNRGYFGYRVQASATAQAFDFSTADSNTNANAVLVAFAGSGGGGGGDNGLAWIRA